MSRTVDTNRRCLWIFCGLAAYLGLAWGESKPTVSPVFRSASLGGQQVLPCEVVYPGYQDNAEFLVTWKKGSLGLDEVLLTKVDGYSPTIIQKEYEDRLEIVNKASLQISHIEAKDQDWYECSIMFMNGGKEIPTNNSWIYLTVHTPPLITASSGTLINMPRGESVKLFCEGKGSPEPKVTWMKDGYPLNSSLRTTIEANQVRIVNLQREDGGIYTCTFANIVGDRSQPMKLVIEGGPYIMVEPGNQTVLEGQRVSFPCGTEGYPNRIIHAWFKDNVDIQSTDGFKAGRIMIRTDGTLVIKTAVKMDRGWYLCRPSNGLGHDEASAYLNVTYKPFVLPLPAQLIWAKGYRQQIDCPVDSNPPLIKVIWVKDQDQIQSKGRFDVLNNGTLLVSEVADADGGSYRCTPENAMGQGLSSNRVQVLVRDPPHIVVSPQQFYIRKVGDSVVMNCEATGTPAVSLQWIKDGGKLDFSSNRITVTDKYLEIRELTKEDHGKYECRAINTIATIVSVTELRIDNTTPHAPFNVTVIPGLFNVTISWQPAYDGGTAQFYVLWFRQVSQFEWVTMTLPGQAVTYFNLYNLQPDTEYEFKILSRNALGDGSFSEVVKQRTMDYSPDAVNSLPVNQDGAPYYPEIMVNRGPEPSAPSNLTAQVKDRNIILHWIPPSSSPVPIFSYKIEYQHDGRWQQHDSRIVGNTSSSATMLNMPTGQYSIHLRSYGVLAYSSRSNSAHVRISADDVVIPQAMIGGIIGGVLFLLVAILLALVAVFYSRRKERKEKEKKYNDVSYGKPDEVNGRHHESSPKWDRWQHNGRGDVVTTFSSADNIFVLPHTRTLDQSAISTRPQILLTSMTNRDHLDGRGVPARAGYDRDYDRQVPLTNDFSFTSDVSQPGQSFKTRSGYRDLDVRNLTWPNQQQRFQLQLPLSKSLQPSYDHDPENYTRFSEHHSDLDHYPHPSQFQQRRPLIKSTSVPTSNPDNMGYFQLLTSQYPSHSIHFPPSSFTPHYSDHYSAPFVNKLSSPKHSFIKPPIKHSPTKDQSHITPGEYQSFHSDDDYDDDDNVFGSIARPPHHHYLVPRIPRQSSLKPSQVNYQVDGSVDVYPDLPSSGVEDISSVLAPSSEHPSQVLPNMSHITLPPEQQSDSLHEEDRSNIPDYYINKSDLPWHMVNLGSSQIPSPGSYDTSQPWDASQDHMHTVVHPHWSSPQAVSVEPPSRFSQHSIRSEAQHSPHPLPSLRGSDSHNVLSKSLHDGSLYHKNDTYYSPDDDNDEIFYYNEPPRPRAHSEGSRRRDWPEYISGQNFNGKSSYGSTSYPDMTFPEQYRASARPDMRGLELMYIDSKGPSCGHEPVLPQQGRPLRIGRGRRGDEFQQDIQSRPTDAHDFTGSGVFRARRREYPSIYYSDFAGHHHHHHHESAPTDSGSHSSGIGSRNTSQSTSSYHHPHLHGSAGKGSTSFSSGHGRDISLNTSGGHGCGHPPPHHQRDASVDENYEFDSLNALENDIMDDLRRYSELSGGAGSTISGTRKGLQDSSLPLPSKPSQYPNSEERFEKLRKEFKQYRQQQYYLPDGSLQRPTYTTAALPIGMHEELLYPMDSEML